MKAEGYSDAQYAHFASYRYLGVLSLALFLGMYIKGRKILPFVYISAISVPLFALIIIYAVRAQAHGLVLLAHLAWGVGFTFVQIPVLPFIFRNSPVTEHTRAISLSFSTQSIANIISSLFVSSLNALNPVMFNEHNLLVFLSASGFVGIYFAYKINKAEIVPAINEKRSSFKGYDWGLILRSLFPTLLFAVGAGFIIPFIGLFFVNVYQMTTSVFSFLCFMTAILVTIVSIYVPKMKEKYGYDKAVPISQIFAIITLLAMATTQYYSHLSIAVYVAALFYLLRQPLMSMAVPMILEVTMKYVGERNREMISGLSSSVWSGAAYFSAVTYGVLRHMEIDYVTIFYITAGLYVFAVYFYKRLLKDYKRREELGLIH